MRGSTVVDEMYILKGCPNCGGDLEWSSDEEMWVCIQGARRFTQKQMEYLKRQDEARQRAEEIPLTVDLSPVPPRPIDGLLKRGVNSPMHGYWEDNRALIIPEAKTYGERATCKRWNISSAQWTTLKKRWGLPLNKRGCSRALSVLPARIPLISSGASK